MYDITIKDGLCFINGDFVKTNIGIEGNRIAYVGKKNIEGDYNINAENKFVLPGLFNAHTHLAMTLFRGYAEDLMLNDWLDRIWNVERKLTSRDVYWGSMLGILEMIKSGTVAFSDHYFYMDEVARAVGETGIRAVLCNGMMDRGDKEKAERLLKASTEFVRKWDGKYGRIKAIVGPHSLFTCTPEFLMRVKAKAEEFDTLIHIHLSETKKEVQEIKDKYGFPPVELLDKLGFLSSRVIIAHGNWLDEMEMKILKESKVSVVHCPVSNLKLASGISRIAKMSSYGINVCIGTDGAASNNTYNMFEEIKIASLLQKMITEKADIISGRDVLRMATENGFLAYGVKGGSIQENMLADIILLNKRSINFTPVYDPLNCIVYGSYGCEVTHTLVNGRIIVNNGEVEFDEDKIIDKIESIKSKFL